MLSAAIASLTLSGNTITGSKEKRRGGWECDLDLSGLTSMGEAMAASKTLTSVDFSNCKMSVAGVTELSKFIPSMAAVTSLTISKNKIGSEGGTALVEAIKSSNLQTIDIGKPLLIRDKHDSDVLDLSQQELYPGQVVILAWWLTTPASAALNSIDISGECFRCTFATDCEKSIFTSPKSDSQRVP